MFPVLAGFRSSKAPVSTRGISSDGRAPALHAGGKGIDAPMLQLFAFLANVTLAHLPHARLAQHKLIRMFLVRGATDQPGYFFPFEIDDEDEKNTSWWMEERWTARCGAGSLSRGRSATAAVVITSRHRASASTRAHAHPGRPVSRFWPPTRETSRRCPGRALRPCSWPSARQVVEDGLHRDQVLHCVGRTFRTTKFPPPPKANEPRRERLLIGTRRAPRPRARHIT